MVSLSTNPVYKHGAIIVRGGSVLSFGYNKSNELFFCNKTKTYIRVHAETDAIRKCKNIHGADLYVMRYSEKTDVIFNSRPCDMCRAYMAMVGVNRVFYSIDKNRYGVFKPSDGTHSLLRKSKRITCLYSGTEHVSISRR